MKKSLQPEFYKITAGGINLILFYHRNEVLRMRDTKKERYSFHLIRTVNNKGYPVIDVTNLNYITAMAKYEPETDESISFNIDFKFYAESEKDFTHRIHDWILNNFLEVERINHYLLEIYRDSDNKLSGGVILLSKKRGEKDFHKILDHQDTEEAYINNFAYNLDRLQETQLKILNEEPQKVLKEYDKQRIAMIKQLETFYEEIREENPIKNPAFTTEDKLQPTDRVNKKTNYLTFNNTKTFQAYIDPNVKTNINGKISYIDADSPLVNKPIGVGRNGKGPYNEMIISAEKLIPKDLKDKSGYTIATPEHGRLIDMINSEIFKNLDIDPTKPDALEKLKSADYPLVLNIKNVCKNWRQLSKVTDKHLEDCKDTAEHIGRTLISYLDYRDQLKEYNKHKKLGLTKNEIESIAYIKTTQFIMNPKFIETTYKNGKKAEYMIFEHYSDLPIFTEQAILLNQLSVIDASRYMPLQEKLTPRIKDYHKVPKNRQTNKTYKETTNESANRARHYLKGLINDGNYNMEHGQRKRFYKDNRLLVVSIPNMLVKLGIEFKTRNQKYAFFKSLERMLNESVIEFPHLLAFKITQEAKNKPKDKILFCYIKDLKKGIGNDQKGKNIVLPDIWNTEKAFYSETYLLQ